MFDEDALPGTFLLCVWLDLCGGRGHGQNHGCADFHLNMEKVVPDVFEIHILKREKTHKGNISKLLNSQLKDTIEQLESIHLICYSCEILDFPYTI